VSCLVGTASADLVPDCVRGAGVRIWPGACQLTVLIPAATGATAIKNLRENPHLAVTLSKIPTHRTVQVKGKVLAIRDGDETDHAAGRAYLEKFATDLEWAGQPRTVSTRLGIWPCFAVDLEIEVAYVQTPGPVAGNKLPLQTGSR